MSNYYRKRRTPSYLVLRASTYQKLFWGRVKSLGKNFEGDYICFYSIVGAKKGSLFFFFSFPHASLRLLVMMGVFVVARRKELPASDRHDIVS